MTAIPPNTDWSDLTAQIRDQAVRAKQAAAVLALAPGDRKNAALRAAADALQADVGRILAQNALDLDRAAGQSPAMLDRLALTEGRILSMADGVRQIAGLDDPIGTIDAAWDRPNGLRISRVRVPLGVIGIIYESRPNVTADAGALCLKSGNAAILRGGSESALSSAAILDCLYRGLAAVGLPQACLQAVPTQDRAAVGVLLGLDDLIDVIIPRGGKPLIERVARESRIPVLKHLDGICHAYLDRSADPTIASNVVFNGKMRRTGVCGATETVLVDRPVAATLLPPIIDRLIAAGCAVRGDDAVQALDPRVSAACDADWSTEYLAPILAIRAVDGVEAAIDHINHYGSHHTDAIIAEDDDVVGAFFAKVDSAILLHNASTQFADGGEFGMGAEIGIATGKLHARGPVGVQQLTSYKYLVRGTGQVRP